MSQTTVNSGGQAIGVAGQVADSSDATDIVSGFNKEATAQIPFGYGVRNNGNSADGYLLATGFSTVVDVNGLSVFNLAHNRAGTVDSAGNFSGDMGGSGLLPNSSLQIARKGRYLVPLQDTVRVNDRAFCVGIATGTITPGLWAGSGYGMSYHIDCTSKAVFRSGTFTAADGTTKVAVLEVDFTNK